MYSTLMLCHMCAGAIVHLDIAKVVVVGELENFHVPETGCVQVLASAIPTLDDSSAIVPACHTSRELWAQ